MTTKQQKILVFGGSGMVGSALDKHIPAIFLSSTHADLTSYDECKRMFNHFSPTKVIHLAAKVGGVKGNSEYVADFYQDNISINTNVLRCAHEHDSCKVVVSLLSTCIYPHKEQYDSPLTERELHDGPPHQSNFGYAYAKRMLEVQSRAYNQQYPGRTKFICAVPNNIFGLEDNFDLENGHVVPSVIRKVYEASVENKKATFWGDGSPIREFTSSNDIARALAFIAMNSDNNNLPDVMNIGNTREVSIKQLVETVSSHFNLSPDLIDWDLTKPMGQKKKPSSNALWLKAYKEITCEDFTYSGFEDKIFEVCEWFERNYNAKGRIRGL